MTKKSDRRLRAMMGLPPEQFTTVHTPDGKTVTEKTSLTRVEVLAQLPPYDPDAADIVYWLTCPAPEWWVNGEPCPDDFDIEAQQFVILKP